MQQFSSLLKCITTEVLPPSLISLTVASDGPLLALAATGTIRHGGSFWHILTEATPVVPCYQNLAMQTQYNYGNIFEENIVCVSEC